MNNLFFFRGLGYYYYISHLEQSNQMTLCLIPVSRYQDQVPRRLKARQELLYSLYIYLEGIFEEEMAYYDFQPMFKEDAEALLELEIRPRQASKKEASESVRTRLISLYQEQQRKRA